MADSLPHNLAFIDMLISDLTQDLAKENQAQQGTEEHDAWMQIWGNVQRLQQLKESLDTKRTLIPIQSTSKTGPSRCASGTSPPLKTC